MSAKAVVKLVVLSSILILASSHIESHLQHDHEHIEQHDRNRHGKIHQCSHDEHMEGQELKEVFMNYENHPYDATSQHNNARRLITEAESQPIRISAYYDPSSIGPGINGLTADDVDFIKKVVTATIRYYQSFVQVIPVDGPWYYSRFV